MSPSARPRGRRPRPTGRQHSVLWSGLPRLPALPSSPGLAALTSHGLRTANGRPQTQWRRAEPPFIVLHRVGGQELEVASLRGRGQNEAGAALSQGSAGAGGPCPSQSARAWLGAAHPARVAGTLQPAGSLMLSACPSFLFLLRSVCVDCIARKSSNFLRRFSHSRPQYRFSSH